VHVSCSLAATSPRHRGAIAQAGSMMSVEAIAALRHERAAAARARAAL
jgi:hypothetical protein